MIRMMRAQLDIMKNMLLDELEEREMAELSLVFDGSSMSDESFVWVFS